MSLIKKAVFFIIASVCALISFYNQGFAQSLGDPVVHITFGSGTAQYAGPLAADSGSTTYTYTTSIVNENFYSIANFCSPATHVGFYKTYDHGYESTGRTDGYMMIVNGSVTPGEVFSRSVPGLCGNTTYQFGVWVKNVYSGGNILPDMVFRIYAPDGKTQLGSDIATGTVPADNKWYNYTANFTLPAGSGGVVIKLANVASGVVGDDFAVDDITFRPYGSTVSAAFDNSTATTQTNCAGNTQTYTIKATSTLASGYVQKLQAYINGVWVDQGAAGTASDFTFTPPATAGTYLYRLVSAITDNIGSASCVVASNELTVIVSPAATPAFTAPGTSCVGDVINFTDQSTVTGTAITSWLWDFGDGQTSTLQSPPHTYAAAGNYQVKLSVSAAAGCPSPPAVQTVQIGVMPKASFTLSTPDCETRDVTFTDASTSEGTIISRVWDFGDGTTAIKTDPKQFTHQYAKAGSYTVTLTVSGTAGCSNTTLPQTITVHPSPVVDFVLPDVCTSDAAAQFTSTSTISDGSALTYSWNFGDPNATAANPNTSTEQNPSHKYFTAQDYTITLTVTSKDHCSATKTANFTVNGDNPTANFTADAANTYCSSDFVVFTNMASVSFGKITMIKMYWDYNGDQTIVTTYTKDQIYASGFKLTHFYGQFNTPGLTKTYGVKMVAYSGSAAGCSGQSSVQTITIKANPAVTLSNIGTICQETGPVQITENKNGFMGTGVFTGTGVSSTGLFDPAVSGPGSFTINYVFTAANGCGYSASQLVTVYPSPTVSTKANLTVLEGGRIAIPATASGTAPLTYKWTLAGGGAATGLDHDDVLNPVASPGDDITYVLTVTSADGCTASSRVTITLLKPPVAPTAFTPNGDGINDTWNIRYLDRYPGCIVSVFNRFGQRLFTSVGYGKDWDGTQNGVAVPVGTYYYIIEPKNGRQQLSGSVTVIR